MQQRTEKSFIRKGFGFSIATAVTSEGDVIKGGGVFMFDKQMLTVAISNTVWTDDDGNPYRLKLCNKVLFMHKLAIGIGTTN